MRWKWLFVLAVFCLGVSTPSATAEGIYDFNIDQPLDGITKYESWMRLEVTVTSRDQPFSGEIELGTEPEQMSSRKARFTQPLTLQDGEQKRVFFDLPAEMIMNNLQLRLIEDGRTVKSEKLRMSYPKDGVLVGVLHSGDNAFHFLATNQTGTRLRMPYLVQNVNPESMPTQPWLYQNLSMLAIGGNDIVKLSDEQMEAIKLWVKSGGIVILSAGPGQQKGVERFSDILSIDRPSGGKIAAEHGLRPYLSEKNIPQLDIPVYSHELPLFVSKKSGEGIVLFVNYDVTEEPLASSQYNAQLWQSVFQKHGIQERITDGVYFDQLGRPMLELSKMIPKVKTPNPLIMTGVWVAYVLAVAPVLYFLLRRKERRQWAWGIIPVSAILLGSGMFLLVKPTVAADNYSHSVTRVQLLDKDLAYAMTASSFLPISGGDFHIEVKPDMTAIPLSIGRNDYELDGRLENDRRDDGSKLSFERVPYLTPRHTVGFGFLRNVGNLDVQLYVQGDRLLGRIKNNSIYSLDQTFIEIGLQRIPIGLLGKGREKSIDVKLESLYLPRQPYADGEETPEQRLSRMQDAVISYGNSNKVRVVGINQAPLPIFSLNMFHEASYYNVITQNVELQANQNGDITYPFGMLSVNFHEAKGDIDSNRYGLWEISKGSVTFALQMGRAINFADRVIVPLDHSMFRPFQKEVFHQKSGKWKPIKREQRLILGSEFHEYLTPEGAILIRFSNPAEQRLSFSMPFFQVEGKERGLYD
ncbi:hypothetical protein NDK47_12745 [Brevibacillus ruminantium]|uniref:Uncharacterized protein n=1 Tax=Brevibacillus ruminantium TaxID=2950604 RepID=A0ABY4WLX8_9BACL|nr:hypothetical protein [Brevibacillus ruminantium]USG68092.1 hypothetical protein NDK47_12745 [Brevibacillus ruminantium]